MTHLAFRTAQYERHPEKIKRDRKLDQSMSPNMMLPQSLSPRSTAGNESETSSNHRFSQQVKSQLSAWHCLIVSSCHKQREIIGQKAFGAGWVTLSSENASDALVHLCRNVVKLVIVDVQGEAAANSSIVKLAEHIMWTGGMLLVTIGDAMNGDAGLIPAAQKTESWARQLGVWSYLPGINDHSDLSLVCSQALEVTEKLHRPFSS